MEGVNPAYRVPCLIDLLDMVEGLHQQLPQSLCAMCSNLLDLRVSITGGVHFDLVKRVLRDISRSEQAPQEIIQQVHFTLLVLKIALN